MVDNEIYSRLLDRMIDSSKKENRYLEFKSNYQDAQHLGEYISALSNGACLDRQDYGYCSSEWRMRHLPSRVQPSMCPM